VAKISYLYQHPEFSDHLDRLLTKDKVFKKLSVTPQEMLWRKRAATFPAFVSTIVGQQISTKAAASIYKKLHDRLEGEITPASILSLSDEDFRACGFSFGKIKYARGIAHAIETKTFKPARLKNMSDENVIAEITKLQGFGVWSAQMFLIFALARPDIWPVGDLGIQIGMQFYLRKDERPHVREMEELGDRWKGHRSAASLLLWHMANNKIRL
jgi:DNA-3-methyladenine glycosylase II